MKKYKNLRDVFYVLSFLMLVMIILQAGCWEVEFISFAELGKRAAICMIISLVFAGCAFFCNICYKVEIERRRNARILKKKRETTANRREIINRAKCTIFDDDEDENTA